jgi:hypothetical protein
MTEPLQSASESVFSTIEQSMPAGASMQDIFSAHPELDEGGVSLALHVLKLSSAIFGRQYLQEDGSQQLRWFVQ